MIFNKFINLVIYSIFYACRNTTPEPIRFSSEEYAKNKALFLNFVSSISNDVNTINSNILHVDNVFLFGAHVFTQLLISNGLNLNKITCILDNSDIKIGKQLYGINLETKHPSILQTFKNPHIIIKAGPYSNEIKHALLLINPDTVFLC